MPLTPDQLNAAIAAHGGAIGVENTRKKVPNPDPALATNHKNDVDGPIVTTYKLKDDKNLVVTYDGETNAAQGGMWNVEPTSTALVDPTTTGGANPNRASQAPKIVKDNAGNIYEVDATTGQLKPLADGATVPGSGVNGGPDLTVAAYKAQTQNQYDTGRLGISADTAQTVAARDAATAQYQQGDLANRNQTNQITASRDAATAQYQQAQQVIAQLDAQTRAGQLSETQRNQMFNDYLDGIKQNAANFSTAQLAGQNAADNASKMLPYYSTPGFRADFANGLNSFSEGAPAPHYQASDFNVQLPDLNAIANQAMQKTLAQLQLPSYMPPNPATVQPAAPAVTAPPTVTPPAVAPVAAAVASMPRVAMPMIPAQPPASSPQAALQAAIQAGGGQTPSMVTTPPTANPPLPTYMPPANRLPAVSQSAGGAR